ncbi:hypothetical protein BSKO_07275 [Bryopsis sp. KO-2023]|nr:hypothetical protein BSKO_07275 [Bryopsis sp. KO-2023]
MSETNQSATTDGGRDKIAELEKRIEVLEKLLRSQSSENGGAAGQSLEAPSAKLTPDPEQIPMAATRVVMHEVVLAAHTDETGVSFGGQVLSWIDICAGLAAKNAARAACVTASLDAVHFVRPCRAGCVAIICAMVNRAFSTSMEVGVRVEAEDMKTGVREHCCSAYLTFVSLKAKGPSGAKLPRVVPKSDEEFRIHREANVRRQARLEKRQLLKSDQELATREALARLQPIHQEGGPTLPPAIRADDIEDSKAKQVAPRLTTAHMTQLIMPQHANSIGITFGGQVLSWMEQCVAISASRLRRGHMLTASIDTMTFAKPTKVGHVLFISSQVTAVFGTSMEVMVTVYGEDPWVGETFHCADAFATVVCVDAGGKPAQIPCEVVPETDAEKIRHEGAAGRREVRLEARRAILADLPRKKSLDGHVWGEREFGS